MKRVEYIFFDLDHTLWDYEFNARKVLFNLYDHFNLATYTELTGSEFIAEFMLANDQLWEAYNKNEIDRDTIRDRRFSMVLEQCGIVEEELGNKLSDYFLHYCPRQSKVIDDTVMILDYLGSRYPLSIITNGFDDVQTIKLKSSGIEGYFQHLFTSESIGAKKPDRRIFEYALKTVGISADASMMIGDNPKTDIIGARNAGLGTIFFNPGRRYKSDCEIEIEQLSELMYIL